MFFIGEPMSDDEIVGHKSFDTGRRGEDGLPIFRHEPLTRAEAADLWNRAKEAEERRASSMPDEKAALNAMFEAWQRLKELGWREAIYCPKDGSMFKAIEAGSTGIFDCSYYGEWPTGSWNIYDAGDSWSGHPILFKPVSEEAK